MFHRAYWLAASLLLSACTALPTAHRAADAPLPERARTAIQAGLEYLDRTQVSADTTENWKGNWPQYIQSRAFGSIFRKREVSPFMVTFVHHALSNLHGGNTLRLGLAAHDIARARRMRRQATEFVQRFVLASPPELAGTYGFWPQRRSKPGALQRALGVVIEDLIAGPRLHGVLAPMNLGSYPASLHIWPDADDTALVHAMLQRESELTGTAPPRRKLARLVSSHRHVGRAAPRSPPWIAPNSGAFLTWLTPKDAPAIGNDVDLVVNANVIYALARAGAADTPGVEEATALINRATAEGRHRRPQDISGYYPPGYAFHYAVSRAYREGPLAALQPAVDRLVADIEAQSSPVDGGQTHWHTANRQLDTAFAALTLLNADRHPELIKRAVRYLIDEQEPQSGAWQASTFCIGRADSGFESVWRSRAFTTAVALSALSRYLLALDSGS